MRRLLTFSIVCLALARGVAAQPPSPAAPGLMPVQISASGGTTSSSTFTCTTSGIGSTSTDGCILSNSTAAANGAQQWSPRIRFTGAGWNGTASQTLDFICENAPLQDASAAAASLNCSWQRAAGGYTKFIAFQGPAGATTNTDIAGAPETIFYQANGTQSGVVIPFQDSSLSNVTGYLKGIATSWGGFVANATAPYITAGTGSATASVNSANGSFNSLMFDYNQKVASAWTIYTSVASATLAAEHRPLMIYPGSPVPAPNVGGAGNVANTAGQNLTLAGGQSTGTGVGGDILFQTSVASGSSSTLNAFGTRWTIKGTGGLFSASATGGDQGADTVNTVTYRSNGMVNMSARATAAQGSVTGASTNFISYTPPGSANRYSVRGIINMSAWATPATFNVTCSYKDDGGVARTETLAVTRGSTGAVAAAVTAVDRWFFEIPFFATDSSATAITCSTAGVFTGSPQYSLYAQLYMVQ